MAKNKDTKASSTFDPLPEVDENAMLSEESLVALQAALPKNKFVFRKEENPDAGVDGDLEVRIEGRFTNFRASVQLKSTQTVKVRRDGVVTFQVEASNLNYLLNSVSPIYFLFDGATKSIYYAWARDEALRIEQSKPNWRAQECIVLEFRDTLCGDSLESIHARILNEARTTSRLLDVLGRVTASDHVNIRFGTNDLSSVNSEQAFQALRKHGYVLVSEGNTEWVIQLHNLLTPDQRNHPEIPLTMAYAMLVRARYNQALGYIAEALVNPSALSESDRQFANLAKAVCNYHAGHISFEQFANLHETTLSNLTGSFALAYELERARFELLVTDPASSKDSPFPLDLVARIRSLVDQINTCSSERSLKTQAAILLIYVDGISLVSNLSEQTFYIRSRSSMGVPTNFAQSIRSVLMEVRAWEKSAKELISSLMDGSQPQELADALSNRATVRFAVFASLTALNMPTPRISIPEDILVEIKKDAEHARDMYRRLSNREGELRATLLVADSLEIEGNPDDARILAEAVLPQAEAMGYSKLIERALAHKNRTTLYQTFTSAVERINSEDGIDMMMSQSTEQDAIAFASDIMKSLRLPERLRSNVEAESLALRDIAIEKYEWCGSIDLRRDEKEGPVEGNWERKPIWWGQCNRFNFWSSIPHEDWKAVVEAFKSCYCARCEHRIPKDVQASVNRDST